MTMADAGVESLVVDASEHARFTTMIRRSVRDVCDGVLAKVPANAEARRGIRAAREKLEEVLVAHARTVERPAGDGEASPSADDADKRARAFRAMAGVGPSRERR
jgi:hypothetical protein